MNTNSSKQAVSVVLAVAFVCSLLVSVAAITLRPVQELNQIIQRNRHVVALTGLLDADTDSSTDEILDALGRLDIRAIDLDTGEFTSAIDPADFDARSAANDPELGTQIPPAEDTAQLGRRSRFAIVYLVWTNGMLDRVILPIHGQGMWSTLYGYIALEADLNTIAGVTFYEQAETAGLGDQITAPSWQAKWRGKQLGEALSGAVRFRVATGVVPASSPQARYEVDALTGATVTGAAVTDLIAYWFGPHGYAPFLNRLASRPPTPPVASTRSSQ
ncbi:MAG TPA: Na(+)-translocating NADH-quinone reductase subunit C [Gammaproteobacteria bacterium]|nr:Na(+)-translocating NADH-quinone reductase subunit C [Gammaproteobacteria bacterium]